MQQCAENRIKRRIALGTVIESLRQMVTASRAANMSVLSIFGLALSVVAFNVLGASADMCVIMESFDVTNNENDIFDDWETELHDTKKSTELSVKMPTKAEVPGSLQMKFVLIMEGLDPIEKIMSFCDALNDELIGKSVVDAGVPKESFPKDCPFISGDWEISHYVPPAEEIPDATPEGPISGSVSFFEEGQDPIIVLDYKGKLVRK